MQNAGENQRRQTECECATGIGRALRRRLFPIPAIMSAEQNPATLDAKVLETAADIHVSNDQGDEVRFGDIFTDSKTVIVFIRARTLPILYGLIYNPT